MWQDTNDPATELLGLLAQRGEYLEAIADGAGGKHELAARFDVSRSTVDRAVRELSDAGLLERSHGEVSLTLSGRLVLAAFRQFRSEVRGLAEAADVLAELADDVPLDVSLFADATVVSAAPHTPQKPIGELEDVIANATQVRTLANSVLPDLVSLYRDRIADGELTADVVVSPDVLDVLVAEHHGDVNDAVSTDRMTLSLAPGSLPYGLVLASLPDQDVVVVICGRETITGIVVNDDPSALDWAESRFEAVESDATRLA